MKVIFYSDTCEYSKKLLAYLEKHEITNLFKLMNVNQQTPPKEIDVIPTIIDTELNQPMKGKKAFEYIINIKYFNNPTNNIDYVKDIPTNPDIPVDDKAVAETNDTILEVNESNITMPIQKQNDSATFYEETKNIDIVKTTQQMLNARQGQDNKTLAILMQMKRR